MEQDHSGKPFEHFADDIAGHCKLELQAVYVLKMIRDGMTSCELTLHPVTTKIINLPGPSEKKYLRSVDFIGFTIHPLWSKISDG